MRRKHMMSMVAIATVVSTVSAIGLAHAAAADEPATIVIKDGATQPVFDYAKRIVEKVWVEAPIDSDADGQNDRIYLDITRPGETATAGLKVGSLIVASPYHAGGADTPYHNVDVDRLPQEAMAPLDRTRMSRAATSSVTGRTGTVRQGARTADPILVHPWEYYTTRGYAMIGMDSLGTSRSTGCPDAAGPNETAATRAVIEWLGGKGRAWNEAGEPVAATWSAKSVGMYGVSYNGTLPLAVAVTGVPELKAIIPMSAVGSWYDEYRANGLVVAPYEFQGEDADMHARIVLTRANPEVCAAAMDRLTREQDRDTGDYSPFWAQRDYAAKAANFRAAVFITQGLADWNVKTKQGTHLWHALAKADVQRKLWLYDGGHGEEWSDEFFLTAVRWFDHYIYGADSGIDREPPVTLAAADTTVVRTATAWPDPASAPVKLNLAPGTLTTGRGRAATETFTDNGRTVTAEQLAANPDQASPNRLAYLTPALAEPARLSGTPWVTLDVSIDNRTAANVTALLVDYGPDGTNPVIVTRGWTDPQNRGSVSTSRPVKPGTTYRLRWDQQPQEYSFATGHRIGLIVLSTDYDYTLRPSPGTQLSVRTGTGTLELPIVGGAKALRF